jgi:hypothetical protein
MRRWCSATTPRGCGTAYRHPTDGVGRRRT